MGGRECNDMRGKKKLKQAKLKSPELVTQQRQRIWQEILDILSGGISVQQQMLLGVQNQSGAVQLQITANGTNPGT